MQSGRNGPCRTGLIVCTCTHTHTRRQKPARERVCDLDLKVNGAFKLLQITFVDPLFRSKAKTYLYAITNTRSFLFAVIEYNMGDESRYFDRPRPDIKRAREKKCTICQILSWFQKPERRDPVLFSFFFTGETLGYSLKTETCFSIAIPPREKCFPPFDWNEELQTEGESEEKKYKKINVQSRNIHWRRKWWIKQRF